MPARPRELTPGKSGRHLFGAELREHRQRAEMSLDALAGVLKYSKSQLARYETAESVLPPELPQKIDACFGTEGLFERLYELARHEAHPDQFRRRMDIEARAVRIEEYTGQIVPGLLQTADYARALFTVYDPDASEEELSELVDARKTRQALLHESTPPQLLMVLDEAVIRRVYGGPEVMCEQLDRLRRAVDTPSTTLQVLPFGHGGHALAGGSLALLTTADGEQVAWEEAISTGILMDDAGSVAHRKRAFDRLRAFALSPDDSAAVIKSAMEELQT